ncbi:hypothetical protein K1719_029027 [Acacia pycnantha]|nr:hypothetical protein K1719_029027 [Acacia pycnantha]
MDKASLLLDAVDYINELISKIEDLESQIQKETTNNNNNNKKVKTEMADTSTLDNQSVMTSTVEKMTTVVATSSGGGSTTGVQVEVRMMGGNGEGPTGEREPLESEANGDAKRFGARVHHASMFSVNEFKLLRRGGEDSRRS